VHSSFQAVATGPKRRRRRIVAESPGLRLGPMPDPDAIPEVIEAVRGLMATLEETGWQRSRPGDTWYAQWYVWTGEGEPQASKVRAVSGSPTAPGTRA
jgi:hypothetical protein